MGKDGVDDQHLSVYICESKKKQRLELGTYLGLPGHWQSQQGSLLSSGMNECNNLLRSDCKF